MSIRVLTSASELLADARLADDAKSRLVGLLADRGLAEGDGLILRPCCAVHTWFMRFPIDVVFVGRDFRVTKTAEHVAPFRIVWGGWRSAIALEIPAGTLARRTIRVGQTIRFEVNPRLGIDCE